MSGYFVWISGKITGVIVGEINFTQVAQPLLLLVIAKLPVVVKLL